MSLITQIYSNCLTISKIFRIFRQFRELFEFFKQFEQLTQLHPVSTRCHMPRKHDTLLTTLIAPYSHVIALHDTFIIESINRLI